jgi:hypothetical protein
MLLFQARRMIAILSIHITCTFISYTKTFGYIYNLLSLSSFAGKSRTLSGTEGLLFHLEYYRLGSENVEKEESAFFNNICTSWLAFMLTLFSPT